MKLGFFSSKWICISTMRSVALAGVAEFSCNRTPSRAGPRMEPRGIAVAAPPAALKKPRREIRELMDFSFARDAGFPGSMCKEPRWSVKGKGFGIPVQNPSAHYNFVTGPTIHRPTGYSAKGTGL